MELLNVKLIIKYRTAHDISLSAIGYLENIKICRAVYKYSIIKSQACSNIFIHTHIFLGPKETSTSQCYIVSGRKTQKQILNGDTLLPVHQVHGPQVEHT